MLGSGLRALEGGRCPAADEALTGLDSRVPDDLHLHNSSNSLNVIVTICLSIGHGQLCYLLPAVAVGAHSSIRSLFGLSTPKSVSSCHLVLVHLLQQLSLCSHSPHSTVRLLQVPGASGMIPSPG